jgi:hypothetical protein
LRRRDTHGAVTAVIEREPQSLLAHPGQKDAEVLGKGDRHRRDEARLNHQKQRPAIQEARQRTERAPQIDVLTTGLGHHRRQLGVAKSPEQGKQAREQPQPKVQPWRGDVLGHERWRDEDPRANHAAHEECRRIDGPQLAFEL